MVAIGEVTPQYLYSRDACDNIRASSDVRRLVLMLRCPVRRTWSEYQWRLRMGDRPRPLAEWLDANPRWASWSRYSDFLPMWLERFDPSELLVLLFEDVFADVPASRARIAGHLGLDASRWPAGAGETSVNEGGVPRSGPLYHLAIKTAKLLRRAQLDGVSRLLGHRLGLKKLAETGGSTKLELDDATRAALAERYAGEAERCCDLLRAWDSGFAAGARSDPTSVWLA
ncbi:MAG: hypothetical protein AAF747_03395 [Planctomycetota bacterium]